MLSSVQNRRVHFKLSDPLGMKIVFFSLNFYLKKKANEDLNSRDDEVEKAVTIFGMTDTRWLSFWFGFFGSPHGLNHVGCWILCLLWHVLVLVCVLDD